jgi:hypothetical protein
MKTITIVPENANRFRAVSNGIESVGSTAGEALDAISAQIEDADENTLIIIKRNNPDRFFNAEQKERLATLMQLKEAGKLSEVEKTELEKLVETELKGATNRAEYLLNELKK